MNRKASTEKLLTLFFIFIAIVLGVVFMFYSLSEARSTQETNSTFWNSTEDALTGFSFMSDTGLWIMGVILGLVIIIWVVTIIKSNAGGGGGV